MCVCLVTQSCPTLGSPMNCRLQAPLSLGNLQAGILEWVAISFSRGPSRPREWTQVSHIAGRFFTIWATRGANNLSIKYVKEKSVDVPKISLHIVIWNFLLLLDFLLLIVNKRIQSAVLGCNLKNNKMISVHFQGKSFNITVI